MSSVNPNTPRVFGRWLETGAISALGPAIGLSANAHDRSWLAGALVCSFGLPFVCGARSGLHHGLASAAILVAYGLLHLGGFAHWTVSSTVIALNCLLVGSLAGRLRDGRARRRALQTRVDRASQASLRPRSPARERASQAQVEERTVAAHLSLTAAIETAGRRMQELATRRELTELLLEVLASQAMVQAATIYWSDGDGLSAKPVARLGENGAATHEHPLVQRALKTRRFAALIDPAAQLGSADLNVLVALPLIGGSGRLLGVLAVHQMPFIALQSEPLRNLLVIARQLSDLVEQRLLALPYASSPPPAPASLPAPSEPSSPPSAAGEPGRDRAITQGPARPRSFERQASASLQGLATKR
jgi:hypothetical protein